MSWEPTISRALTDNAFVRRTVRRVKAWAGHPVIEHHKWHFLALGMLILVAVPWGLRAEERGLENAGKAALAEARIPVVDVSFNGRNAVVTAPIDSAASIEAALGSVRGVRRVSVTDAELLQPVASSQEPSGATPTTVAPPPTSTTTTTLPPRPTLSIRVGNTIRISGALPDAITVSELADIADFMYGGLVENKLVVDSSLAEPVWLESADDVLRLAPWLSKGSIELEGDTATLEGTTIDADHAMLLVALLQAELGADVPLTHDVGGATGPAPSFEIVAGAGTIEMRGTMPNRVTIRRIATSVEAVGDDAELTNETVLGEGTPATYLTLRTPYMIRVLGTADSFSYRYEAGDVRGSVVGEAFFASQGEDTTIAMDLLVDALAATLIADPDLVATIEIHSSTADSDEANLELSHERAAATLAKLVRAGVDPARITVTPGDGTGELLRFSLTAAEN